MDNTLKFADSHEWVRDNGDGTVTIGISEHAQEMLGDVAPASCIIACPLHFALSPALPSCPSFTHSFLFCSQFFVHLIARVTHRDAFNVEFMLLFGPFSKQCKPRPPRCKLARHTHKWTS